MAKMNVLGIEISYYHNVSNSLEIEGIKNQVGLYKTVNKLEGGQ